MQPAQVGHVSALTNLPGSLRREGSCTVRVSSWNNQRNGRFPKVPLAYGRKGIVEEIFHPRMHFGCCCCCCFCWRGGKVGQFLPQFDMRHCAASTVVVRVKGGWEWGCSRDETFLEAPNCNYLLSNNLAADIYTSAPISSAKAKMRKV